MKIPVRILTVFYAVPILLFVAASNAQTTIVFDNVTVIPMDGSGLLTDHSVVVAGDTIVDIYPTGGREVSQGALHVDGTGHFVTPGLADMHVHPYTPDDFPAYLAHGVTTVLMLNAPPSSLAWRGQIDSGELVGPTIYYGRLLDGPGDVEDAVATVRQAAELGYDYIKMYNSLTLEQFAAAMSVAQEVGIPVVSHAVRAPGMKGLLDAGVRMIVHGEEYLYTVFRDGASEAKIDSAIAMTKESGAYVTPNLSAYEAISLQWGRPAVVDSFLSMPQSAFLSPRLRSVWRGRDYVSRPGSLGDRIVFLRQFTGALHRNGIPLLLGTDAPGIPGMYPGHAIHEDVRNMLSAGLEPYDVMVAGTRAAGQFVAATLDEEHDFGVIRPGMRADLLLLKGNPLEDPAHLTRPEGVMTRGRWYTRQQLDEMLADLARRFEPLHGRIDEIAVLLAAGDIEGALGKLPAGGQIEGLDDTVENAVNRRGYELLNEGDLNGALHVFRLNTEHFPNAFNTWDSLAEAYMIRGDTLTSIRYYEKSLDLNPDNVNAVRMLDRLGAQVEGIESVAD